MYKKIANPICPIRKLSLSSFKDYGLDLAQKRAPQLNREVKLNKTLNFSLEKELERDREKSLH